MFERPRMRRAVIPVLALVVSACGPAGSSVTPAPTGTTVASNPSPSPSADVAPQDPLSHPPETPIGSISVLPATYDLTEYDVRAGAHPHDVSPAHDGGIWYTGQRNGTLGHLDPESGEVREIRLGAGSAPHGVITGPDGAAWITDGGQNAIVRVNAETEEVEVFPLPRNRANANLNTAVFDAAGTLWFTGQAGIYGRLDPDSGAVDVWDDPEGSGPYGITATADGSVWYASLGGSHIARVDPASGEATILEPPTAGQGARRVWADSTGRIWVSEWNAGQIGVYDPATDSWQEWRVPGDNPMIYSVFVDDLDQVWVTDFGSNSIIRFDEASARFDVFDIPSPEAAVRQLHGRPGEVLGAESATDKIVVLRARRG
jgi:virginiamycin B lyase